MLTNSKIAEALRQLKAKMGQPYIKPNAKRDLLNSPDIDEIIQLGKASNVPIEEILKDLKALPLEGADAETMAKINASHLRRYPSKVAAAKYVTNRPVPAQSVTGKKTNGKKKVVTSGNNQGTGTPTGTQDRSSNQNPIPGTLPPAGGGASSNDTSTNGGGQ
jgi:hypothetical protein